MPRRLTKKELLFELSMEIEACARCPYCQTRDNPIIGEGECRSPILVVGPSVRKRDDEDRKVFAGRAAKKLESMLRLASLDIGKVYRTYLVRCFGGRQPQFGEFSAFRRCQDYSVKLMKIMRPVAVVVCGYKAFKWLIIRWTNETIDDRSFYRWVGKAVRLKEVWGEIKFFVIESPAQLAKARNPEAEMKSIEGLTQMKAYVVAQQRNESIALDMVDLKQRGRKKGKQKKFDWAE